MNIKDKFKLFQWLEALIWILVLSIVICGVRYHAYKEKKSLKTYQIFLQDVDGLIVGSPVRMMGTPIGYIENIKIVGDNVYVKFILTQKGEVLPEGSIATVEFNGLGGSKSLEIYPPTSQSLATKKLIVVQNPKRLNSAISLLDDMFDKLNSMMIRGGHFASEMKDYMPAKSDVNKHMRKNELKEIDKLLDRFEENRMNFKNNMKELKDE